MIPDSEQIERIEQKEQDNPSMKENMAKVFWLLLAYYLGCFLGALIGTFFFEDVKLADNILGVLALAPLIHLLTIFVCANKFYFGIILTLAFIIMAIMTIHEYFKTDHVLFIWAFAFLILMLSIPSLTIYQSMNEFQPF
jgi:magnesium-transporting ATPase (P-type)